MGGKIKSRKYNAIVLWEKYVNWEAFLRWKQIQSRCGSRSYNAYFFRKWMEEKKKRMSETDFLGKKNNACEKHMDLYNLITYAFS